MCTLYNNSNHSNIALYLKVIDLGSALIWGAKGNRIESWTKQLKLLVIHELKILIQFWPIWRYCHPWLLFWMHCILLYIATERGDNSACDQIIGWPGWIVLIHADVISWSRSVSINKKTHLTCTYTLQKRITDLERDMCVPMDHCLISHTELHDTDHPNTDLPLLSLWTGISRYQTAMI